MGFRCLHELEGNEQKSLNLCAPDERNPARVMRIVTAIMRVENCVRKMFQDEDCVRPSKSAA